MYKDSIVGRSPHVAHILKGLADLLVPDPSTLLCTIDCFNKAKNHVNRSVESRWWFHEYFLLQLAIEISSLDIHLVELKVKMSS